MRECKGDVAMSDYTRVTPEGRQRVQARAMKEPNPVARADILRLLADLDAAEAELAELREKMRLWETGEAPFEWLEQWPVAHSGSIAKAFALPSAPGVILVQKLDADGQVVAAGSRKSFEEHHEILSALQDLGMEVITEGGAVPEAKEFDRKEGA